MRVNENKLGKCKWSQRLLCRFVLLKTEWRSGAVWSPLPHHFIQKSKECESHISFGFCWKRPLCGSCASKPITYLLLFFAVVNQGRVFCCSAFCCFAKLLLKISFIKCFHYIVYWQRKYKTSIVQKCHFS